MSIRNELQELGHEAVIQKYSLHSSYHKTYPNLLLLKYDQINTPDNEITRQCRGAIFDINNDYEPICVPFERFFNLGEERAARIDWETAKVYSKLDGSLCCLWYYNNSWQSSTSGSCDASGPIGTQDMTFHELITKAVEPFKSYIDKFSINCTYIFELISPYNKIVCKYDELKLVLLAIRVRSGQYYPISTQFWPEIAKEYNFKNAQEATDFLVGTSAREHEGFVVVNSNGSRVKIKSSQYLRLHRMKSSYSRRNLMNIVLNGETEEIRNGLPEFENEIDELQYKYNKLLEFTTYNYTKYNNITEQKEFALAISHLKHKAAFFNMRSGKVKSFQEFYLNLGPDKVLELLND